jgi:hypothetical protein
MRSVSRQALELERSVERVHPVGEAPQPGPVRRVGAAHAVVVDVDEHTTAEAGDADPDA